MARVRLATATDIPCIVDMIEHLRGAIGGPIAVDRAWTARTVAMLIASPTGCVWLSRSGFIAGSIQPTIINPAPVAMEHGWWARDGSGLWLLRAFEAWAQQQGATMLHLSTGPEGLDLSRLGYRIVERAWVKNGSL